MNCLVVYCGKVKIPPSLKFIHHNEGDLPDEASLRKDLPKKQGTNQIQTDYDLLFMFGSHGNVNQTGKTTQLNGCNDPKKIKDFLAALRNLKLQVKYVVIDFCFSASLLADFYPIIKASGKFVGWGANCPAQRQDLITGNDATAVVKNMVRIVEKDDEIFNTDGSDQIFYLKGTKELHCYSSAVVGTYLNSMLEEEGPKDFKDYKSTIRRIGKKKILSTARRPAKIALKVLFGVYWWSTPGVLSRIVEHDNRASFLQAANKNL